MGVRVLGKRISVSNFVPVTSMTHVAPPPPAVKDSVLPKAKAPNTKALPDCYCRKAIDALSNFCSNSPAPVLDYVAWAKHYYERCLLENPEGKWANSAYSAGWDLVGFFLSLWDDESVSRKLLLDLKKWLAKLYTTADEGLRLCIVNATLEHLFERKDIRKYFSDWQQDPVLAPAYKEACLWEGKTPLSRYNKQAKPAKS